MKILEYNDIDYSKVRRQYEKGIDYLEKEDFRSADVKKLVEHDLYRARLDDSNRLIFKIVTYKGVRYALILEVVLNHAYDKSKFLRGVKIDENKIPLPEDNVQIKDEALPSVIYINPSDNRFYFLDKIIPLTLSNKRSINPIPRLSLLDLPAAARPPLRLRR